MKICAYCGHQNEDAAVSCVECGKQFETRKTPDPELLDPSLSPKVVATFNLLQEAKLLVDRLQAAGIDADIPEEYGSQVFSAVIPLEPITVRVAAKDYPAAISLLGERVRPAVTDPDADPKSPESPPL